MTAREFSTLISGNVFLETSRWHDGRLCFSDFHSHQVIAAGMETASSDIDLMIVGEIPLESLLRLLKDPEKVLGRAVNPSLYSLKEYRSRMKKRDPFMVNIMEEPIIMLIGDEGELRRTA